MIGFDIGGTKCAVTIGEETEGKLIIKDKRSIPTDHTVSAYEMIDRMCQLAEEMTDDFTDIGISCGGPLNSKTGVILSPPNLPGWDEIRIVEYLKDKYHGRVAIQNDANACAVAEWKYGAGVGTQNMVFLTFGSGLGAGLILDGRLYSGTSDMAGEVGHVRLSEFGPVGYGKAGSFEGFCSGGGIAQLARTKVLQALQMGIRPSFCPDVQLLDTLSAKSVAEAAHAGDELAKSIYRECGFYLGRGLSLLIDIINPEVIVLGSIYERSGDLLEPSAMEVIAQEAIEASAACCRIVGAQLGDQIGDYAALSVAYEKGLKG